MAMAHTSGNVYNTVASYSIKATKDSAIQPPTLHFVFSLKSSSNTPLIHALSLSPCTRAFFSAFSQLKSQLLNNHSYLLTECTKQLLLAMECLDPRTQLWLRKGLPYWWPQDSIQATICQNCTYEAVQHDLQCASTAIHANVRFKYHSSTIS